MERKSVIGWFEEKKVGEEKERSRNRRCGRGKGKAEVLRELNKVCG